ncbi:MAG: hypothetical protein JXD21_02080 [Candidatus Omnitrophica bacterium]|nr:hypothetical protein [Candidatus Omnitrophota bacterium]
MEYNQYFLETLTQFFTIIIRDGNFWIALMSIAIFILAGATYRISGKVSEVLKYQKVRRKEVEQKVKKICTIHLKDLLGSLSRVYPQGNPQTTSENVQLDRTTFNEIQHGLFIYYDIILKNLENINVAHFTKTIDFFHNYKVVLEHLGACMGELTILGEEKSEKYHELVGKLQEAIKELS